MTTLRLYRGIAVLEASVAYVTSSIRKGGLIEGQGNRSVDHLLKLPTGVSIEKHDLNHDDTGDADWHPAVCACGTVEGASYYAWEHNRSHSNSTPILIEFEARIEDVRIDGRDFLFPAFQWGDPEKATTVLQSVYGDQILKYAGPAWDSADQGKRIALCDLATMDPEVVLAHYANRVVVRGRCRTTFESAFTIALPVLPEAIIGVWVPDKRETPSVPLFSFRDLLTERHSTLPENPPERESTPTVSIFDLWKFKYKE